MLVLWVVVTFALMAAGHPAAGQALSDGAIAPIATDTAAAGAEAEPDLQGCSSCTLRHRSMTKRYEELKAAEEARGDCQIKGEIAPDGARIYYRPGEPGYGWAWIHEDKGERWFCSVGDAEAAGWRAAE